MKKIIIEGFVFNSLYKAFYGIRIKFPQKVHLHCCTSLIKYLSLEYSFDFLNVQNTLETHREWNGGFKKYDKRLNVFLQLF